MAQLLSTNVSGTLAVTQNVNVAGNLIVSGYNVLNEIFQADNLARVSANSGATQSAVALNFVNTATVQVSVASGGAGVANIGFTSLVSGGVTSVGTGTGLTGGPITSSGTISANIANTTVQGVTKLIDSVTSTDAANAATGAAVKVAFDQATTAYGQANLAYAAANTGLNKTQVSANGGSVQTNVAINFNNTSSIQVTVGAGTSGNANVSFNAVSGSTTTAGILQLTDSTTSTSTTTAATPNSVKTAFDQATLAYGVANTANTTSIAAYGAANSAANTVQVSANSGGTISKTSLNFNNTATIRVNLGPGSAGNANLSFDYIGSVSGGSGINNFPVSANAGATVTANGINFVNSSTVTVTVTPGVGGNANISFTATTGGTGTVQSVGTGTGLTGGTITVSGTISANIASTTVVGVTKLIDSVTTNDSANAATGAAVKTAFDQATTAYGQANTANSTAVSAFNAANNAANTVRVTANSGTAQSAVSLNFVNTATIRVNVGSGTTGNANISFDYIGSVTGGGGGINNFPVSANSGSTVTANGLNFVNSSYATVSVSAGTTGNANVAITPIGVQTQNYASVYSNKQMMEWVHNRDGKIFKIFGTTTPNTPSGVFANTSGTRFYVLDDTSDLIHQLNLSEAWNIASAATETANLSIAAQETQGKDLFLSNTGSTLYLLGDGGNDITWYDLSQSWNVQTATANSQFSVAGQTTAPRGMFFKEDGTKFWVTSATTVFQYAMTSPWNLATAAYESISLVTSVDTSLEAISIDPTGSKMYLVGSTNDRIYEFNLSTPFNVSTGTYNNFTFQIRDVLSTTGISVTETGPTGLFIAYPNNRMYVVGTQQDTIIQYEMDRGITIEAKRLFANGRAHFMDDVTIFGDLVSDEGVFAREGLFGSSYQCTISNAGVFSTSAATSDFGTSTANSTYTLGSGGTLASRTKTIDIGTNGVAGSFTNITVGPTGVAANVNINANTTTFSNTVNIGNQLIVSGLNIINEIGLADNLARVSANSGSIKSAVALNFVNTSTVTVSVTDGETGYANISFSSSGGPGGGVTSVATGIGLTGGPITSSGTISANIASTSVQGVTKLIDSVTSTDAANAATGAAVKTAFDQATDAYTKANTAHETAVLAYGQANTGLNKTQVSANGGSVQTNVAINFNNTSSIQVSVGAGTSGNANVAFTAVAGSTTAAGILQLTDSVTSTLTTTAATPNSVKNAFDQATRAYTQANVATNRTQVSANSGSIQSNVAINFENTASIRVSVNAGTAGNADVQFVSYISGGSVASGSTITPVRTGPHSHYTVTALAVGATINPPAINSGVEGDRLTLRLEDNGTGRALTWNTSAGAYRAVGVTLPTTTVATKVHYIGSIYNSTDNFWDVVAYVVQA